MRQWPPHISPVPGIPKPVGNVASGILLHDLPQLSEGLVELASEEVGEEDTLCSSEGEGVELQGSLCMFHTLGRPLGREIVRERLVRLR